MPTELAALSISPNWPSALLAQARDGDTRTSCTTRTRTNESWIAAWFPAKEKAPPVASATERMAAVTFFSAPGTNVPF